MATVMNQCPKCGKGVPISFETSKPSFDSSFPLSGSYKCPHCHTVHQWLKQNLWIEESAPPYPGTA